MTGAADHPPTDGHRIYNLGNHRPETTLRLVDIIEGATGKKAVWQIAPAQPGEVEATYSDITAASRDLGFHPHTSLEQGIARFVAWYRDYHKL